MCRRVDADWAKPRSELGIDLIPDGPSPGRPATGRESAARRLRAGGIRRYGPVGFAVEEYASQPVRVYRASLQSGAARSDDAFHRPYFAVAQYMMDTLAWCKHVLLKLYSMQCPPHTGKGDP